MTDSTWMNFLQATKDRPPSDWLVKSLAVINTTGRALDLGCGAGRDVRYLLSQGWDVTAVDQEAEAIAIVSEITHEHLRVVSSSFEDFDYGHETYDLISAQYSLPFLSPAALPDVFTCIKDALVPGGWFTGQFFGIRDTWNTPDTTMTFLTRDQVDDLLKSLNVIEVRDTEQDGTTAVGDSKHWHVFDVLAQKGK